MTKQKIETIKILINNLDDLLNCSHQLLNSVADLGQYTQILQFLNELREEYRFWATVHYKTELKCKLMLRWNEYRLFKITMPEHKVKKA